MSTKALRIPLLITIFALYGLLGIRMALTSRTEGVNLLLALGTQTAFPLLCRADARAIGKPVTHAFLWVTFFLWPLLVPGYLIWSRGLKGLALALLLPVLIIFSVLLPFLVTLCVLHSG